MATKKQTIKSRRWDTGSDAVNGVMRIRVYAGMATFLQTKAHVPSAVWWQVYHSLWEHTHTQVSEQVKAQVTAEL